MRFHLLLSIVSIYAQQISYSYYLKNSNDLISGVRGEIEEKVKVVRTKIDEGIWHGDPNLPYTIRIGEKIFASVPLGLLQTNGFNDEIVVFRDENGCIFVKLGIIYHIDYSIVPSTINSHATHFTTIFKSGPVIQAVRPVLKKTVAIHSRIDQIESKTFFQQYWIYLVPVLLFLLFAPPEEPIKKRSNE